MSFEDVEIGPMPVGKYWKPESVGEYVEGHLYDWESGDYGEQIVLDLGHDQETILPAHSHLKRYYPNLEEGDYIRVEVTEIIPPKTDKGYSTFKYRVQKDPERKLYEEAEVVE